MKRVFFLLIIFWIAIQSYGQTKDEYLKKANSEFKLQNFTEAIKDYSNFISIDSTNAAIYYLRGLSKSSIKDFQGAIEDLNKAVEIKPSALALYLRAMLKAKTFDLQGSIDDLTKSIEVDPNNAEAYFIRGSQKSRIHDYGGAVADITKSLEIDPENSKAYPLRAKAKLALQDYRGAILDFTKAIDYNSKDAESYYFRGLAKLYFNEKDNSGCMDLSRAGELGYAEAYDSIQKYCN